MSIASIIAKVSLDMQRFARNHYDDAPGCQIADWREGRASAAAQIEPTPENLSAANECKFLANYARRHFPRPSRR